MAPGEQLEEVRHYQLVTSENELFEFDTEAQALTKQASLAKKDIPSNIGFTVEYVVKAAKKAAAKPAKK